MSKPPFIIAIDGHAASGKGTLARALAERLGCAFLDTGAVYRLIARKMVAGDHDPADEAQAIAFARELPKEFTLKALDDPALRTEEVSRMVSKITVYPGVRAQALDIQKNFANHPPALAPGKPARGAVLDGRDIGTVVCPQAPFKFFITASPEIRAQRRFKELQNRGVPGTYEAVLADMRERDARDSQRATAPLKPAADAVILDTSDLTPSQVLEAVLSAIMDKQGQL